MAKQEAAAWAEAEDWAFNEAIGWIKESESVRFETRKYSAQNLPNLVTEFLTLESFVCCRMILKLPPSSLNMFSTTDKG